LWKSAAEARRPSFQRLAVQIVFRSNSRHGIGLKGFAGLRKVLYRTLVEYYTSGGGRAKILQLQTEIQRLQGESDALRKELADAAKSNQQYLQNVAHQLTAPLNAIKWSIEALRNPAVPLGRKSNLLSSIYDQGTILVNLIKNFALMSKLDADKELGQFGHKLERVDPLRLSINLANDFQPQASEGGRKIIVDTEAFDRIPSGKALSADKNLIAQALSNLLENAVKYSDLRSTINIDAVPVPFKNEVRSGFGIRVTSTGLPLDSSEIAQLQERGFRGKRARQIVPPGTGIGLYLARRIMELHQGAIGIKGHGKESQFTLIFHPSKIQG
jgi:signal transduction histidine kinase